MIQELLRPRVEIGNFRLGRWHTINTQEVLPSRTYVRVRKEVLDITKGGCYSHGDRFEEIAVIDDDTLKVVQRDLSASIDPVKISLVTEDGINGLGIGRLRWVPS